MKILKVYKKILKVFKKILIIVNTIKYLMRIINNVLRTAQNLRGGGLTPLKIIFQKFGGAGAPPKLAGGKPHGVIAYL